MADEKVVVPIELTVTDIKTKDVSLKEVEQSIKSRMSGIAKSASDVLGKVDTSKLNKSLTSSMDKVTSSYQKLSIAQAKLNDALQNAGSSSPAFKKELQAIQAEMEKTERNWESFADLLLENPILQSGLNKRDMGLPLSQPETDAIRLFEQAADEYEAKMADLQSRMPNPANFIGTATTTELQKIVTAYHNVFNAVNKVESATRDWNEATSKNQMTDEYTKKVKELETYEKKLESVRAKAQKMGTVGASDKSWKNLHYDADILEQKIHQVVEELQNMVKTGNAFRFDGGDAEGVLSSLSERLSNTSSMMDQIKNQPNSITAKFVAMDKTITNFCNSAKKGLANVISMFKRLGKTSSHTAGSMQKSMKKLWKDILMFGFGVRSTFFLVRRLRNVFINSFKEMATQIPEVNTQISSFMTSLNQIKGSLATAFQPIVSAIIPWLNQLMAALNNAMNAMARFFATLTGQGYIYKFTAAQVDYAESLDKTGSAAKKAQKSLMGFDEINRLNDNSDSGAGGGGDTPTGTWEKEMLNGMSSLAEMIKEAWTDGDFYDVGQFIGEKLLGALKTADEWILTKGYGLADKIGKSLATLLNGVIETQDLGTQIGKTIADGLNMGMIGIHKFFTTANWISLGQFIADWANASVKNFKWDLLGQTIASLITAAVNTWWKFVGEFDFSALGQNIATAINNLFDSVLSVDGTGLSSSQKLGQAITNTVRGILTTLTDAINNTDWSAVGQTIGEVLANIDWSGIAIDLTKLVGAIVKALGESFAKWTATEPISAGIAAMLITAFAGINIAPIMSSIAVFGSKIVEALALTLGGAGTLKESISTIFGPGAGVFSGIVAVVGGVITAVSNFFSMLSEGFSWVKEILMLVGIAIAAVGAIILGAPALVAGVIAGIVAAIATIIVVVKDNWDAISAFLKAVPGWIMDNIVTPVVNFFKNLGTNIVQLLKDAWTGIQNVWKSVSSWFNTNVIAPVVNFFKTAGNNIGTFFKNTWTSIQNTWKSVTSWFTNTVINPVKNGFSNSLNSIKGFFSNCLSGVKSIWNGAIAWFKSVANNIKTAFNNAVNGVKSAFSGLWSGIKSGCKAAFNSIIGFIERGINGLINGINKAIGAINSIGKGAAKLAGINFTGISKIPTVSLPRLAQGGVIPPNNEFMAILGDQKHGTNIEAPLDTIKQAVAEELAEYIDAMMTGFQAVVDAVNDKDFDVRIGDNAIGKAAERYSKRQALIRGTT